jgi:hypothetical protein
MILLERQEKKINEKINRISLDVFMVVRFFMYNSNLR